MDPLSNPYTPSAGAQPLAMVGRDNQLQSFELLLARIERGRPEQSMIITGLRGVGKTVLLGKFRNAAAERKWIVVEMEASKSDEAQFRTELAIRLRTALFELSPSDRWGEKFRKAAAVLQSFTLSTTPDGSVSFGFDVGRAEGFADTAVLHLDLIDLFIAVGEAAQEKGRGVVLVFDEVQFLSKPQLEALIMALHKMQQRNLPITLVAAGLPQIAELAGDAQSYSERLFKFPRIGHLSVEDAAEALAGPARTENVVYTQEAIRRAWEVTEGYPYFIQELGYAVWGIAKDSVITDCDIERAIELYESKLDESFFRVRLDRATELQRIYMRAMAELGPQAQKAADVAEKMGRDSKNLAPTRAELINMGMLYTPEHGYASFTVPHFDRFMLRAVPHLEVPPVRKRQRRKGR